jgi:hypothetical protein
MNLGIIVGVVGALASLVGVLLAVYFYYEGRRERPERRVHDVIMDGMTSAGKTTFIARLASPVTSREALEGLTSTLNEPYTTVSVPICWERTDREKHTLLHELRFTDVAGEDAAVFVQGIRQLADSGVTSVVLVIMWDLSQPEQNMDYLNRHRLRATYGLDESRALIKSVVVFLNKTDKIENREERERRIEAEKERIAQHFGELFDEPFNEIKFHYGSTIEGTGVHYCFGEIIKDLKLEHNFQKITGQAKEV